MSKKDFLKLEQNKSIRTGIIVSAILCYVSAGITTLAGLLGSSIGGINFNAFVLVDAAVILALGLFIHLKQSFPASIILLVYSIVNTIYMSIQAGTFGGWLILIAGIGATYYTYKLNKDFKAFSSTNQNYTDIPTEL